MKFILFMSSVFLFNWGGGGSLDLIQGSPGVSKAVAVELIQKYISTESEDFREELLGGDWKLTSAEVPKNSILKCADVASLVSWNFGSSDIHGFYEGRDLKKLKVMVGSAFNVFLLEYLVENNEVVSFKFKRIKYDTASPWAKPNEIHEFISEYKLSGGAIVDLEENETLMDLEKCGSSEKEKYKRIMHTFNRHRALLETYGKTQ